MATRYIPAHTVLIHAAPNKACVDLGNLGDYMRDITLGHEFYDEPCSFIELFSDSVMDIRTHNNMQDNIMHTQVNGKPCMHLSLIQLHNIRIHVYYLDPHCPVKVAS